MADYRHNLPTLIAIVGVDGSGKTTLANWLSDELKSRGRRPILVWSRFRNYLSKPLLALSRLTGHNYYKMVDGARVGYHDFEKLVGYRELFAVLQSIDVNIAAYLRITRIRKKSDIVLCERGPWDTLVDVISDTGLRSLTENKLGELYLKQVNTNVKVILIDRSVENILSTRTELVYDLKLPLRMEVYRQLALLKGWVVIDNNGSLDETREAIKNAIGLI